MEDAEERTRCRITFDSNSTSRCGEIIERNYTRTSTRSTSNQTMHHMNIYPMLLIGLCGKDDDTNLYDNVRGTNHGHVIEAWSVTPKSP